MDMIAARLRIWFMYLFFAAVFGMLHTGHSQAREASASKQESGSVPNGSPIKLSDGEDAGTQINQAYAELPAKGGHIRIPSGSAGCWQFSTPIVFSTIGKQAVLEGEGASSCLQFIPRSGTAITFDNGAGFHLPGFGMQNVVIKGSGGDTVGLRLGMSAGVEGFAYTGGAISDFGTGVTFGSNTWNAFFSQVTLIDNVRDLMYPESPRNSGENITFDHVTFAQSHLSNFANCVHVYGAMGLSMQFTDSAFDNCQLHIERGQGLGAISVNGVHFENPSGGISQPFVHNEGGAVLSISNVDVYNVFANPAQVYPIVASGPGATAVTNLRLWDKAGAVAALGVGSGHHTFIVGTVWDGEMSSLPAYALISGYAPVSVIGSEKSQQVFASDKSFLFQSGRHGAMNGAVGVQANRLTQYLWSGRGDEFYAYSLENTKANELDICQAPAAKMGSESLTCKVRISDGTVLADGFAAGKGISITDTNSVAQYVGTIITTGSSSDTLEVTGLPSGAHCQHEAQNAAASLISGVFLPPSEAGKVILYHSPTAGAAFSLFCSYR